MNTDWVEVAHDPQAAAAEIDRLTARIAELETAEPGVLMDRITELEQQLSRYQGGVEVECYVWTREVYEGNDTREAYFEVQMPIDYAGQRVRVLVIPEERIVGSNKTMEVE